MKKNAKVLNYRVILEQDEDRVFVASAPSISGCYTQGGSFEEAMDNIKEVIGLHLQARKELRDRDDSKTEFVGIKNISFSNNYGTFAHI